MNNHGLKYKPEFPKILLQYSEDNEYFGGSISEVCKIFGVDRGTIYNWMGKYELFKEAVDKVREVVNEKVENALLKSALGYSFVEKRVTKSGLNEDSETSQIQILEKYQAPNVSAQKLWLLNRKGAEWKEKQEVSQSGNITVLFEGNPDDYD